MFEFKVEKVKGHSKRGELVTPHGVIKTPVFMPVGTKASVKAVSPEDLKELGAEIILGNTYHLYLRPGDELIKKMGQLHEFSRWSGAMLTDSGGFQVSSLGHFREDLGRKSGGVKAPEIDEEGVSFYSHIDGSKHRFTPEKSIDIQHKLGADIIMAFDEATPDKGKEYAKVSMDRTHRWLDRCTDKWKELEKKRSQGSEQALFGIIQGGVYPELRRESAEYVAGKGLKGIAVGGGSIGQNWEMTEENVNWMRDLLPKDKPVYFMGVGTHPVEVMGAILSGADMFDCVAPTRQARTGILYNGKMVVGKGIEEVYQLFKPEMFCLDKSAFGELGFKSSYPRGRLHISNEEFSEDDRVIDDDCDCYTCRSGFSRAYLRHLFKSKELLYYRLASIHNLRMMIKTAGQMREWINKQD